MYGQRYRTNHQLARTCFNNKNLFGENTMKIYYSVVLLLVSALFSGNSMAENMDNFQIYQNGRALTSTNIKFPAWFKHSFYDLREDLAEARKAGKRGIIIMLSQETCSTCLAFLKTTFSDPDVVKRVQQQYDVIGMNIFSNLEVIDPDGTVTTVKDYAEQRSAALTPTILFYGVEHVQLVKLVGFYPPEKFTHVLDYIDGTHYTSMQLSAYLRDKRIKTKTTRKGIIREVALFNQQPYDMTAYKGGLVRPMLVLFETPDCNPCQRFHDRVLAHDMVRTKLQDFYAIQLDASDNSTKVIIPDGRQLTPKQWYEELKLSYDVAVVFFNERGSEVLRHDAEIGQFRMAYTMEYVLKKGYLEEKQILRWRRKQVQQQTAQTDSGSEI